MGRSALFRHLLLFEVNAGWRSTALAYSEASLHRHYISKVGALLAIKADLQGTTIDRKNFS